MKHEVFIGCNITKEQRQRNIEHYEEIKDKIKILSSNSVYGNREFVVFCTDKEITLDEIALVCDRGNLSFGYSGRELEPNTYFVNVNAD